MILADILLVLTYYFLQMQFKVPSVIRSTTNFIHFSQNRSTFLLSLKHWILWDWWLSPGFLSVKSFSWFTTNAAGKQFGPLSGTDAGALQPRYMMVLPGTACSISLLGHCSHSQCCQGSVRGWLQTSKHSGHWMISPSLLSTTDADYVLSAILIAPVKIYKYNIDYIISSVAKLNEYCALDSDCTKIYNIHHVFKSCIASLCATN